MKSSIKCSILALLLFASGVAFAQVPDELVLSLKTGNAKVFSSYMHTNVELYMNEKEEVYSKTQAEQILYNFFKENEPTGFNVIHQSGQGESKYAIGTLNTKGGSYRVSFLVKELNKKPTVFQIRIEKQ